MGSGDQAHPLEPLTDREQEVLELLARGKSNREVADTLVLSVNTVKWHNQHIYKKLGVGNREQAAARGRELGLVEAEKEESGAGRHNLPAQPMPLIGREAELARIASYLKDTDCRLLTLVGPPGIGKTRLAIGAAEQQLQRFMHGVTFVPLAPLQEPALLAATLADAVGLKQGTEDPKAQLLAYVEDREMLLLLDNFEHLLPAAGLLDVVLSRAPQVKIMVTSRQPLNLQWEWLLEVAGLDYPAGEQAEGLEEFAAVKLFSYQARRRSAHFPAGAGHVHCTAEICRLAEGNPLAITLAAAWMGAQTCREIAGDLQRNLAALQAPWQDVSPRHRSLYAAVEHSWSLLSDEEQQALRGLSVFRGGFQREAAQAVTGASGAVLGALAEKSLLQRTAEGRYDLHEMVRQFAAAKLAEAPQEREAGRAAHSRYYTRFLERMRGRLWGKGQRRAMERVEEELDNVRAAWERAVEAADAQSLARGGDGLFLFCEVQTRYREARDAFGSAAEALEEEGGKPSEALVIALVYQGLFTFYLGNVEAGTALFQRGRALARLVGDALHEALANYGLGLIAFFGGAYEEAEGLFEATLSFSRRAGYAAITAHTLNYIGWGAASKGEVDRAEALQREALAVHEAAGDEWGMGRTFFHLAEIEAQRGEHEQTRRWLEKGLGIFRRFDDHRGIISALNLLAETRRGEGETARAREVVEEAVQLAAKLGEKQLEARSRRNLAEVCLDMDEEGRAKEQLRQALALAAEVDARPRLAEALVTMARLFARQERPEEALELLAYVVEHPQSEAPTRAQVRRLFEELSDRWNVDSLSEAEGQAPDIDALLAELYI